MSVSCLKKELVIKEMKTKKKDVQKNVPHKGGSCRRRQSSTLSVVVHCRRRPLWSSSVVIVCCSHRCRC